MQAEKFAKEWLKQKRTLDLTAMDQWLDEACLRQDIVRGAFARGDFELRDQLIARAT